MPAQAFEQGHFYISAKYTCKLACPYTLGMTAEGTGTQPKPSLLQGLNNNSRWLPGRGTGRLTLTTSKNKTSWRKASQHVEKKWLQDPITLRSLWTPTSRKTKDYSSKVRIMLWCFSESILLAGCRGEAPGGSSPDFGHQNSREANDDASRDWDVEMSEVELPHYRILNSDLSRRNR